MNQKSPSLRNALLRIVIIPTVTVIAILFGVILLSAALLREQILLQQQVVIEALARQGDHYLDDLKTSAGVAEVAEYYRSALEGEGFEVSFNTFSGAQGDSAMISAEKEADGRTVIVAVNHEGEETTIGVTYNQGL